MLSSGTTGTSHVPWRPWPQDSGHPRPHAPSGATDNPREGARTRGEGRLWPGGGFGSGPGSCPVSLALVLLSEPSTEEAVSVGGRPCVCCAGLGCESSHRRPGTRPRGAVQAHQSHGDRQRFIYSFASLFCSFSHQIQVTVGKGGPLQPPGTGAAGPPASRVARGRLCCPEGRTEPLRPEPQRGRLGGSRGARSPGYRSLAGHQSLLHPGGPGQSGCLRQARGGSPPAPAVRREGVQMAAWHRPPGVSREAQGPRHLPARGLEGHLPRTGSLRTQESPPGSGCSPWGHLSRKGPWFAHSPGVYSFDPEPGGTTAKPD